MKLRGVSLLMEMCYDGTLVMPANYAVVSEDEMTYVDGGGKHWYNSVDFVAGSIDVLLWMLPNLGVVNTALNNGGSLSTVLGAVGVGKDKLVGFAVNALKKVGIKKASQKTVERAIGLVWVYSRLTIGTLIAEGIDSADGCDDGYLFA